MSCGGACACKGGVAEVKAVSVPEKKAGCCGGSSGAGCCKEKETWEVGQPLTPSLQTKLQSLINTSKVMVFIKGKPTEPKCKFTKALLRFLMGKNIVKFGFFDILEDSTVRESLKVYSNWQTYPQLYISGELVGGLDIVRELDGAGELMGKVPADCMGKGLFTRVKAVVERSRVMLMMQGTPEEPKTEEDKRAVELLKELDVEYGSFDVSTADDIRLGHQQYAMSQGYPQLWVGGEHIGNLEGMLAKHKDGKLADLLRQ